MERREPARTAELRVDGLVERRVEGLVVGPGRCARQDLRGWLNSGRSCAGSFARTVELLALVWWSDGPLRRRDVVCRRAIAAPWWFAVLVWSAGGPRRPGPCFRQGPMSEAGRSLGADRPSLVQPLARSARREPWMAGYAEAWTGGSLLGAPYPSQGVPSARCAGREPGQPGLARGSPEARPGP